MHNVYYMTKFYLQNLMFFNLVIKYRSNPLFDKKQFVAYMKKYIELLTPKLNAEKQAQLEKGIEGATNFLLSKLSDLQL